MYDSTLSTEPSLLWICTTAVSKFCSMQLTKKRDKLNSIYSVIDELSRLVNFDM